jgi:hypothetical protein
MVRSSAHSIQSFSLAGLFVLAIWYSLYFAAEFILPVILCKRWCKRRNSGLSAGRGECPGNGTLGYGVGAMGKSTEQCSRNRIVPSGGDTKFAILPISLYFVAKKAKDVTT